MNKKRPSYPTPLGEILRQQLQSLRWDKKLREQEVFIRWEEAVGPQIAARARPSYVKNKRLTITVDNPAWAQQLFLLKNELLLRLSKLLGTGSITDLFFVTGKIEASPKKNAEPPPNGAPPSPELLHAIDRETSKIPDASLREAFRNLRLAAIRRQKAP